MKHVRGYSRTPGQAVALFALVLSLILAALALVIDVGFAYADRRYQQDAADAASLSAAEMVFDGHLSDTQIVAEINRVVALNRGAVDWSGRPPWYVDGAQNLLAPVGGGSIPSGAAGVGVISQTTRQGYFSWIVGMPTIPVSAMSVAMGQQVHADNGGDGLIPLSVPIGYLKEQCPGINESNVTIPPSSCNVDIELKHPSYHKIYPGYVSDPLPANWKGVIDFSPKQTPVPVKCPPQSKPQDVKCWIEKGFEGQIVAGVDPAGDDLPTFGGDIGSNTSDLLRNIRTDADGRQYGVIYTPIYDSYSAAHNEIHVITFAAFVVYLDEIHSSGITGHLTKYTVSAGDWKPGGGTGTFTAYAVRMVPPGFTLPWCEGGVCSTPTPALPTETPGGPTATAAPPTATHVVMTMTPPPPTATLAPTTATMVPPTVTSVPPTATQGPPTATTVPPTATPPPCTTHGNGKFCNVGQPPGCQCPPGSN